MDLLRTLLLVLCGELIHRSAAYPSERSERVLNAFGASTHFNVTGVAASKSFSITDPKENDPGDCHLYPGYAVWSAGDLDDTNDFSIQVKTLEKDDDKDLDKACKFDRNKLAFHSNGFFEGMFGDLIFSDEPSGLRVMDLKKHSLVVLIPKRRYPVQIEKGSITYWQDTGERASPTTCGSLPKGKEMIASEQYRINLNSSKREHVGTKCFPIED